MPILLNEIGGPGRITLIVLWNLFNVEFYNNTSWFEGRWYNYIVIGICYDFNTSLKCAIVIEPNKP